VILAVAIALIALSVTFAVLFIGAVAPGRQGPLGARLAEFEGGDPHAAETLRKRRRQLRAERLASLVQALGERIEPGRKDIPAIRLRMLQAGFPSPSAVPVFLGSRIALPIAMGFSAVTILGVLGMTSLVGMIATIWFAALGYIAPGVYVNGRIRSRQKQMQKALPDALDLLVVCVEAGLGLNQAMVRVSEEIERLSPVLSEQLALVNLEIRAGTAREEAFRNMGERTGLDDIKSLMAMLIQTDRFGTSIAQALRVQADTLRTKRRQRAEEAAAKTTIKLVFPLVLFIFPAMFVVILGSAIIQIFEALGRS
jgi:tight adherence protein C